MAAGVEWSGVNSTGSADHNDPGHVYFYMENLLKKHWYAIYNELKERWPDLTQSDLEYIFGEKKRLVEIVKRRRHISAQEASRDVDEFVATLNIHQRITAIKS